VCGDRLARRGDTGDELQANATPIAAMQTAATAIRNRPRFNVARPSLRSTTAPQHDHRHQLCEFPSNSVWVNPAARKEQAKKGKPPYPTPLCGAALGAGVRSGGPPGGAVRTQHSYDEELLEPLPVVVDGVTLAPATTAPTQPLAEVVPHAFEAIDAMCTRILEVRGLAALAPWLGPQSSAPEAPPPALPTTFGRIFELHPAHLESLPDWWRRYARNGRVTISRRLTLGAPRRTDDGVWRMRASLRGPLPLRPLRMELSLWRHLGTWTKLTLEPQRRVWVKSFYFTAGHRALDVLCDRLPNEFRYAGYTLGCE
jgi:hypothetical protein